LDIVHLPFVIVNAGLTQFWGSPAWLLLPVIVVTPLGRLF
jgi:hypothetical protein